MAYVVSVKSTVGTSGSCVVDLPSGQQDDDVIFIWFSGLSAGTITDPSGWQTLGSTPSSSGVTPNRCYYQRVVTAPLSNPTISYTGSFNTGAIAVLVRGADVSTTTSALDTWSESTGNPVDSVTSPTLTLTDANELILLFTTGERGSEDPFFAPGSGADLEYINDDRFAMGAGYTYDQNSPSDQYTAYCSNSSGGGIGIFAVAVADDGNGIVKGYAETGHATLVNLNSGDHGETVTGEVNVTSGFTPLITSVTNAESGTSQTCKDKAFAGDGPVHKKFPTGIGLGTLIAGADSDNLVIRGIEFTSTVDLSNSKLCFSAAADNNLLPALDTLGRLIGFGDNTNASMFLYDGKDATVTGSVGIQTYMIDTSTTGYEIDTFGAGSLNWAAVKHVIHGVYPSDFSGQSYYVGPLYSLNAMKMLGGSSALPCTFDDAAKHGLTGALNTVRNQSGQTSGQFYSIQDIDIGNGSDDVYWVSQFQSIEFPPAYGYANGVVQVQADAGAFTLGVYASAGSTVDLDITTINMGNFHNFTINASTSTSATYSFDKCNVLNGNVTLQAIGLNTYAGLSLIGCKELTINGFTDRTTKTLGAMAISNCTETYAVTVTTRDEFEALKNVDFSGNNYSIRITGNHGGATWSLAGATVTGGTGSYDLRYEGTGTLTVEVDAGSGFSQVRSEATVGTLTISAPSADLTINSSEASSDIRIFTTGTQTQIASATSNQLVYTHSSETIDWTVQKAGFLPQRGTAVALSGNITIDVSLVADPVYDASHGLTYTTDASWSRTNNQLTVPSFGPSVRAVHSLMIDSFISESALRNTAYNISMNGPNAMFLVEDAEGATDGDIENMTAGGVRYVNTSGTTTAEWCGIESVGTATGFQGEYQQQDGSGTTDARATGKFDEIIKIYGDLTHGNFDYRSHLVLKFQPNGYKQVRVDVPTTYGISTLEPTHYIVAMEPQAISAATGDPAISITVVDHTASPLVVGGKSFDWEIQDNGTNSAEDVLREWDYNLSLDATYQGLDPFNWPDFLVEEGSNYATARGTVEGDGTNQGCYVSRSGSDHPGFARFQSNDGTYYVPVTVAQIEVPNVTAGRIQIVNETGRTASTWAATTAYSLYNKVLRSTGTGSESGIGLYFQCTTAGTSGGTEPTWDTTPGNTTADGTITWTCRAIEFDNTTTTSGYSNSWTDHEDFDNGDTIRMRWTDEDDLEIESTGVATEEGTTSFLDSPEGDTVYTSYGITGSTVTEYSADYPNVQVDVTDPDNVFYLDRFYAWYKYNLTTADGIRNFFGAVTATNTSNITINNSVVDIYFDNTKAVSARQGDTIVIQRADGAYPQVTTTSGGGGLGFYYSGIGYSTSSGSGLDTTERNKLLGLYDYDPTTDTIEGSMTYQEAQRVMLAESAGKVVVSGATVTFRDQADSKDRITATVDDNGQRTSVTVDGS